MSRTIFSLNEESVRHLEHIEDDARTAETDGIVLDGYASTGNTATNDISQMLGQSQQILEDIARDHATIQKLVAEIKQLVENKQTIALNLTQSFEPKAKGYLSNVNNLENQSNSMLGESQRMLISIQNMNSNFNNEVQRIESEMRVLNNDLEKIYIDFEEKRDKFMDTIEALDQQRQAKESHQNEFIKFCDDTDNFLGTS